MITKELLFDSIVYSAMIKPKDMHIEVSDTVRFRGDAHGFFKTKLEVKDNRFHPLLMNINGLDSTTEYKDTDNIKLIDTIDNKEKKSFIGFLDRFY